MTGTVHVVTSNAFNDDLASVTSIRLLQKVAQQLVALASFPDMGRVAESQTLVGRFGEGVRTLVCGNYLLVYVHEDDTVKALALYPARLVC